MQVNFRREGDIIQRLARGLEGRFQNGEIELSSIRFCQAKRPSQPDVAALAAVVQEIKVDLLLEEYERTGPSFYLGALDLHY